MTSRPWGTTAGLLRASRSRQAQPAQRRAPGWVQRYRTLLITLDAASAIAAVSVVMAFRFPDIRAGAVPDASLAVALPVLWVVLIAANSGYAESVLGVGTGEYRRLVSTFLVATAVVTFGALAAHIEIVRGVVLVSLLGTVVTDLGMRLVARQRLNTWRRDERATIPVVAVGDAESVADFAAAARRNGRAGIRVVGAALVDGHDRAGLAHLAGLGIPAFPDGLRIDDVTRECGAQGVVVLAGAVRAGELRNLAQDLEGTAAHLYVSPGLVEVAARRMHIQALPEQPLVLVEEPRLTGAQRAVKAALDRLCAVVAVLVLSPLLVGTAIAVRVSSRGPVLFRQERVGLHGRRFTMVKFRSMYAGAEDDQAYFADRNDKPDGPTFKLRDDPRMTRVGRIIRRYSLDELPQLFNVIKGDMSLVGPRPPLPGEVSRYRGEAVRRLLVKPGITGLWQVSGRSDLSWEESVRLDVSYVENWSLWLDIVLLARTAAAVVRADGAY